MVDWSSFKLPKEYSSLVYLSSSRGDVGIVEDVCTVWNKINTGDTVRVKETVPEQGHIILTGVCRDKDLLVDISMYVTTFPVLVTHEPTYLNVEI